VLLTDCCRHVYDLLAALALKFLSYAQISKLVLATDLLVVFIGGVTNSVHIDMCIHTNNTNTCSRNESASEYVQIELKILLVLKNVKLT
jgi:hypothetical protein